MIFQYTWKKVLSGEKTQTRRIVKPGQEYAGALLHDIPYVYRRTGIAGMTKIYEVGKTYAVQPGRGKQTVYTRWSDMTGTGSEVLQQNYSPELANWGWKPARIHILRMRREDVRCISEEDAKAEGCPSQFYFWDTWIKMYDPNAEDGIAIEFANSSDDQLFDMDHVKKLYNRVLASRPIHRYQAWVLEFERA